MKRQAFLSILLIGFFPIFLFGNSGPFFRNFTVQDGLPSPSVNAIAEDSYGNIWLGTNSGLCKFDGQRMKLIQSDAEGNAILSGNYITSLEWIQENLLAVGTYENGLNLLDIHTLENRFFRTNPADTNGIADDRIMFMKKDNNQWLWIGLHQKGLQVFDKNNNSFRQIDLVESTGQTDLNNQTFRDLLWCDKDSNYFFLAGSSGVYRVEKTSGKSEFIGPDRKKHPETGWSASSLAFGNDGMLLLGLWGGGILMISPNSGEWAQFLPDTIRPLDGGRNIIRSIERKNDNEWWIATHDQGLIIMDGNGNFKTIEKSNQRPGGIPESMFWHIFKSSQGDYWFAGRNGISFYKKENQFFSYHSLNEPKESRWQRLFSVLNFLPSENEFTIYIGCWVGEGLYEFDIRTNEQQFFPLIGAREKVVTINGLARNSRGDIFIGTLDDGLFKFDPKTKKVEKLDWFIDRPPRIRALVIDQQDKATIACANNGIVKWDLTAGVTFLSKPEILYSLSPGELITSLSVDQNGRIAAGGNRGAIVIDPKGYGIQKLNSDTDYPTDFRTITSVHFDYKQNLWLGTENKGVFKLDTKLDVIGNYGENEGLTHNYVNNITSDRDGHIFITHNSGLNIFNPQTEEIFSYSHPNGLFKDSPVLTYIDEATELVFVGSQKGFFVGNKKDLIQRKKCSGGKIHTTPLPTDKKVKKNGKETFYYKSSQNNLSFYFNDYSFRDPSQLTYRFRLVGWNENFIYTGIAQTSANYEFLPPGKYTFEVQSRCNYGHYYDVAQPVSFVIRKAFYDTYLFRAASLLFLIGIPLFFVRSNQKRKREKLSFEKRLSELKMESLRAQMNPHFIFNSLNSIRYYIQSQNHQAATKYLNKFSYLIRLILDYSRSQTVSIGQELEFIRLYLELEQSRFKDRFQVHFFIEDEADIQHVEIPPMLTQPFVENAIWHGLLHKEEDGNLRYEVRKNDDEIMIIIKDDGVGRAFFKKSTSDGSKTHKSHGMEITRERIDEFNKLYPYHIKFEIIDHEGISAKETGTEVRLSINTKG